MYLLKTGPTKSARPLVSPPGFEVRVGQVGDEYVIHVKGELDRFDRPRVEDALLEAEASQAGRILLDLEDLTFIDAAGLCVLLNASHRSAKNGGRLRMTRGKGNVAEMLHLTGLDLTLPFVGLRPGVRRKCVLASATVEHV